MIDIVDNKNNICNINSCNADYYKEKLIFYRLLVTLALTALSGCIAWFFAQLDCGDVLRVTLNVITIMALFLFSLGLSAKIKYYCNRLKRR